MRKLIFALTLMISAVVMNSCDKQEITKQETGVAPNAVWVTPTGKVIPYSEAANWQAYEKEHFSEEKMDVKYGSDDCTTPTITCGKLCKISKLNDCTKESPCAPCMNCGCTPSSPVPN